MTDVTQNLLQQNVRTKDKVLQIIAAHGVPIHDVAELRDLWGPFPPHARELTRVLWDLQKQGEVKFNEIKAGRDSLLTKIRLSRGIDMVAFRANDSKGRHPIGKDLTDPKHHHWVAQGGPIERSYIKEEPMAIAEAPTPRRGPKPKDNSQWLEYISKINPNRVRPMLPLIARGIDQQSLIQKELGISSPRVSSLTSRALQLGWVTKDQRAGKLRLDLTEEGSRLAAEPFIDERSDAQKTRSKRTEAHVPTMEAHDIQSDTPPQYPQADTPPEYQEVAPDLLARIESTREYPDILQTNATIAEVAAAARRDSESTPATVMTTAWPRIIDVVELEKYPLISDLMTKEDRLGAYEAAAKLLEGFDADLALSLLEKIQLTPLETEVIAFIRSLR